MYEITKLDVNRIYRYLDKYMEKMEPDTEEDGGAYECENDINE